MHGYRHFHTYLTELHNEVHEGPSRIRIADIGRLLQQVCHRDIGKQRLVHRLPHGGVHNPVKYRAVLLPIGTVAEYPPPERGAIQRASLSVRSVLRHVVRGKVVIVGGDEEVGRGGAEVFDDSGVACCAGLDDLAGEEVGVDDGE